MHWLLEDHGSTLRLPFITCISTYITGTIKDHVQVND